MWMRPSSSFQSTAPTLTPLSATTAPPPSLRCASTVSAVSFKALGGGWLCRDWVVKARRISAAIAAESDASAARILKDCVTRSEAAPDALAQGEGDLALGPVLPEGGDAGVEQRARVLGRLEEEDVVVLLGDVVAERAVAWGDEVRVGVDQPGQHGCVAVVAAIDGGAVGRAYLGGPAHLHDAPVLHEQGGLGHGRSAAPIEESRRGEEREAGALGHGLSVSRDGEARAGS